MSIRFTYTGPYGRTSSVSTAIKANRGRTRIPSLLTNYNDYVPTTDEPIILLKENLGFRGAKRVMTLDEFQDQFFEPDVENMLEKIEHQWNLVPEDFFMTSYQEYTIRELSPFSMMSFVQENLREDMLLKIEIVNRFDGEVKGYNIYRYYERSFEVWKEYMDVVEPNNWDVHNKDAYETTILSPWYVLGSDAEAFMVWATKHPDYNDIPAPDQNLLRAYYFIERDEDDEDFVEQYFQDNVSNDCVFKAIESYFKYKIDNAPERVSKKVIANYQTKINKAKYTARDYPDGVKESEMTKICDIFNVTFNIYDATKNKYGVYKSSRGVSAYTINLLNTRFNHVDVFNMSNKVEMDQDELNQKLEDLKESNDYYLYAGGGNNVFKVITPEATYVPHNSDMDVIGEFTKKTKLEHIKFDAIKYTDLFALCWDADINGQCVDIKSATQDELHHVDHRRSFSQFQNCPYYTGFFNPTDYRTCPPDLDLDNHIGIFYVTDVTVPEKPSYVKELLDSINMWNHDGVYCTPDLLAMRDLGIKFTPTHGCWGPRFDFSFTEDNCPSDHLNDFSNCTCPMMQRSRRGARFYALATGMWSRVPKADVYTCKADDELASAIAQRSDTTGYYCKYTDEYCIEVPKQKYFSLMHVAAFIKSYSRCSVIEQLLNYKPGTVYRVQVDGIYSSEKPDYIRPGFRYEKKKMTNNAGTRSWCYKHGVIKWDINVNAPAYREHYRTEICIGAGGSGKTHAQLHDKGFTRVVYVAPTNLLLDNKRRECKEKYNMQIETATMHALLGLNGADVYSRSHPPQVIVIDEATESSKETLLYAQKRYPYSKIIYCGDFGKNGTIYQLPEYQSENAKAYVDMDMSIFENVRKFTTNHRMDKDDEEYALFAKILKKYRKMIYSGVVSKNEVKRLLKQFMVELDDLDKLYNRDSEDIILVGTNKAAAALNSVITQEPRYRIIKTVKSENLYTGAIMNEKPDEKYIECYEPRHGFTCHSVQGITVDAPRKVFIELNSLFAPQAGYVALSRVRQANQIHVFTLD